MRRRDVIKSGALLPFVATTPLAFASRLLADSSSSDPSFDASTVPQLARSLAASPYKAPDRDLPDSLKKLDYDGYRKIRFEPARALWRDKKLPFEVQLFHRGFFYQDRVDIFEVDAGKANRLVYTPSLFQFDGVAAPPENVDLGFAGFRLHAPINRPDYFDEICAFLGASYFRGIAKGQIYGLSARGLSLNTAGQGGEEFPLFKSFWLERPQPNATSVVVHGLLDSPGASAAMRFTIRPGEATIFDVQMTIYPRVDLTQPGIGTATSMFFFGPNDRLGVDDYRQEVHDSDGLSMWTGRDEQLWRPLTNPAKLQISTFADTNPRGFGMMQRRRDFSSYDDLEARYEKRPSLWMEPIGDWGSGAVELIEIPSARETDDNIVAFWRPKEALRAKGEYSFVYRLYWGRSSAQPSTLATVSDTRIGAGYDAGTRLIVIDLMGDHPAGLPADAQLTVEAANAPGVIKNAVIQTNVETGGWRVSFELATDQSPVIELRAFISLTDKKVSEIWTYRWAS